jgi:hypothetical protein
MGNQNRARSDIQTNSEAARDFLWLELQIAQRRLRETSPQSEIPSNQIIELVLRLDDLDFGPFCADYNS